MKKIVIASLMLGTACLAQAQQNKGLVVYDRISQMQIRIAGGDEGMEQHLPKTRTDKFELTFGNNQSLWKQAEQEQEDMTGFGGEGMQIRTMSFGSGEVLFTDLGSGKRVMKRELFDKTFVIDDTVNKLKWKMTGETKSILNQPCMKAVATLISPRMMMTMDNGKMDRKETMDTSTIVAWFTSAIPVSAGPAEYQGQLPGLILEMDIANGRQIFKAVSLEEKADLAVIKEPTGKKRVTQKEFRAEQDKMFQEMQLNNQGGGQRIIRMN